MSPLRRVLQARAELLELLALLPNEETPQVAYDALLDAYECLGVAVDAFKKVAQ